MENAIVIIIIAAIVGGIVWYLWKAKKRGDKCIGCPHARQCGGNCGNSCNTSKNKESTNDG